MGNVRVFCSHRGVDKPRVKAVAEQLAAAGIDPWVDQWEISPGDDIVAKINAGLEACDVGLIFFSQETLGSEWVRNEVSTLTYQAIEDGKPIIPVMLDADAPIPPLLRPRARVAAEDLQQLIDAIHGRRHKPVVASPSAQAETRRFHLALERVGERQLKVVARVAGGAERVEVSDYDPALAARYQRLLQARLGDAVRFNAQRQAQEAEGDLLELGKALGAMLLPGAVGTLLVETLAEARGAGATVAVECEAAGELLSLPFGALRLPDGQVLSLQPGVRLLQRCGEVPPRSFAPLSGPLRILVAIGAPDEGLSANPVLDYERELQTILDAIDHARRFGNAEVRILEVGHPDEIRRALAARSYHVLHLSGHGRPGQIELEDEAGQPVPVSPGQLADVLQSSGRTLPLIFLAACHGGTTDGDSSGFAQGLLAHGIPQVLAMQGSVSDWYATRLAGNFYEQLSRMEVPLASQALALARQAVEGERQRARERGEPVPGAPEYATPALFSALATDVPLIDRSLPQAPPAPPPPPLPAVGQMPLLRMDDLIGRRAELRRILNVLRGVGPPGVLVRGMGGVGKSAVAGRVMARLREDGWVLTAVVGRWSLGELAQTVGSQLITLDQPELARIGRHLLQAELPDEARLALLQQLLANHPLLLVLDNFEDNLEPGGKGFIEETTEQLLIRLLGAARRGRVLITCRYPLPGEVMDWLADEHLGPLSPAQTRKLFYRLASLRAAEPETLGLILRHIGGHPRLLEYLDALLRQGQGRLPEVTRRLRKNARRLGLDAEQLGGALDEALRDALRLGVEDILLDQLLAMLDAHPGDRALLHQAAVFPLPIGAEELAAVLAEGGAANSATAIQHALRRLIDSSLLTPVADDRVWVHRWTAQALWQRQPPQERLPVARRAGEYLARRARAQGRLTDAIEATRLFLLGEAHDRATETAWPVLAFMDRYGQQADVAAFAAELLAALPPDHHAIYALSVIEGDALMVLGDTGRAFRRYQQATHLLERLVAKEPERADYQRDLSVSYERMGDLYRALGEWEAARAAYQKSLDIRGRLVAMEPERADYQWDLVISLLRLADEEGNASFGPRALAILRALHRQGKLTPDQQALLAQLEAVFGE